MVAKIVGVGASAVVFQPQVFLLGMPRLLWFNRKFSQAGASISKSLFKFRIYRNLNI